MSSFDKDQTTELSEKVDSVDSESSDQKEIIDDRVTLNGSVEAYVEEFLDGRSVEETVLHLSREAEAHRRELKIININNDELGAPTSVVFVHHDKSNLIVNGARRSMSHLLGEFPSSNLWQVTNFKMGTMGNVIGDILTPIPPLVTDQNLVDPAPFSKRYSDVGSCSINPDVNYTAPLCSGVSGIWTPNPDTIQFLPPGSETSVQFMMIVERAEANGSGIVSYTEAGLFCENGVMFARETFPTLVKTPSRRFIFLWSILF